MSLLTAAVPTAALSGVAGLIGVLYAPGSRCVDEG
jgi:hypothetical protein